MPEQRDRMKVLYADNSASAWKSAGKDVRNPTPGIPEQIGTIDFEDKKAVLEQLDLAQAETKELDHEVNYSVTADGKVWRVSGGEASVDPSDIPSSLEGSYSFHNHPRNKTGFSFSAEDLRFFFQHREHFAMASDYLYQYTIERTKDTIAIEPDVVYHRFMDLLRKDVLELKWNGEIDPDQDEFHSAMEILSKELKFKYERKKTP